MSTVRTATASGDSVLTSVGEVRRALARIFGARIVMQAIGAGTVSWLVLRLIGGAPGSTTQAPALVAAGVAALVALGAFVALWRRLGTLSPLRAALWIEERGDSGYSLVTWVEQSLGSDSPSPLLGRIVAESSRASIAGARRALAPLARAQLAGPLLFALAAVFLAWRSASTHEFSSSAAIARGNAASGAAPRAVPIGQWRVRVTPPAYSGLPSQQLGDVNSLRALSGTRIELIGGDAAPDSVHVRALGDSNVVTHNERVEPTGDGWRSVTVATSGPLEVRVSRDRFAKLLLVEGVPDSVPHVVLTAPARDSVLRRATGLLPLVATVHDDIGLARASFEVVISSGEGERFTSRTVQVGAQALHAEHDATLRGSLDLSALQLGPGDVVHMRALARDAHPLAGREAGTSETRSFRVARPSEYDSVAVEPAPPPEVDKSLLSQRMLLMLTEKLEKRRPQLAVPVLREEARVIARDQGRLRQAVGDAVFQRLSGEAGGEHSHSADDGHDHGVEVVGGKLALSGVSQQGVLEEGDDSPVIAINKPLLEAYNAMWDAQRSLEQSELRAAIPFMRIALAAIERARAASRLYLRGRPPTVIIDLAKVRLVGKDTGAPDVRAARQAVPSRSANREARLLSAASLVSTDPTAARDSLAVLRIESLADAPAFAEALAAVLEEFSRGSTADLTEPFLRARRVLGGIARVPATPWSRGGPP